MAGKDSNYDGDELLDQAEHRHRERLRLVTMALNNVACDLHLARLVWRVFDYTKGGIEGALVKTNEELGLRPFGLCCKIDKARSTVRRAVKAGLLTRTEDRYRQGGQGANSLTIDWSGVRRLAGAGAGGQPPPPPGGHTSQPGGQPSHPGGPPSHPGGQPSQPGGPPSHPYKDNSPIDTFEKNRSIDSNEGGGQIDQVVRSDQVVAEIRELCRTIDHQLNPARHEYRPDNRRLLVLAATLAVDGVLDAHSVHQAVDATVSAKPIKRWAFFRTCLLNACRARHLDFHQLEVVTSLPDELLTPKAEEGGK